MIRLITSEGDITTFYKYTDALFKHRPKFINRFIVRRLIKNHIDIAKIECTTESIGVMLLITSILGATIIKCDNLQYLSTSSYWRDMRHEILT